MTPPAVILVAPQMGENIGAAARAMMNCALADLRLVAPRDGWPNERARAMASGADPIIDAATVHRDSAAAIADLHFVIATTARARDMTKPVFTPDGAAAELRARAARGERCGLMFGGERSGLDNEDVARAHALLTVPLNPEHSSLNLAQAVLLVGYAWFRVGDTTPLMQVAGGPPAAAEALENLLIRVEMRLRDGGFFPSPEMAPVIMRNLRNLLGRASPTDQEIRTLHGVFKTLAD